MIYLDASVALSQLLDEDRHPSDAFWDQQMVSSRLLEYEIWTCIHSQKAAIEHADRARELLERMAFVELTPTVLERARAPYPTVLRTLDALHLASADYLRGLHRPLRLASYDKRMLAAAKSMNIPAFEPD